MLHFPFILTTLCILIDFRIHIDAISVKLPIFYFEGSQVEVLHILMYLFLPLNVVLILAKSFNRLLCFPFLEDPFFDYSY